MISVLLASVLLAFFAGLSDLLSGIIPFYYKIEDSSTRYIIGFAAGTMLGAVFFEMLPELAPADSIYIGVGFFFFYLLERLTMIHSCGEYECTSEVHRIGWLPVIGMASDNIIDGIGIAVAYAINPLTGIIVGLSVIVHEVPQGITTNLLLRRGGQGKKSILLALGIGSILYPIGAALSILVPAGLNTIILAIVTGDFLYIAASDLLPDAHKKFNIKVIFSVILGAVLVFAIESFLKM
ncbi:MAG: ZIP family metal transporter [Candidatus Methanoperedens sp.]